MKEKPWALVTGASSGIGAELSLVFAREGWNLALSGRDRTRLDKTAERCVALGAHTKLFVGDLGTAAGVDALIAEVAAMDEPPEALVNNAGFSVGGPFLGQDADALLSLIGTNIAALTRLSGAVLNGMVARGRGRILNLASVGSFFPCPNSAVYCASKAYVLSFSEALAEELSGTGVTVTALCPGATRTRFADRAGVEDAPIFKAAMPADRVAEFGYQALMKGKRVAVPGALNALQVFSGRFAPRRLAVGIAGKTMGWKQKAR